VRGSTYCHETEFEEKGVVRKPHKHIICCDIGDVGRDDIPDAKTSDMRKSDATAIENEEKKYRLEQSGPIIFLPSEVAHLDYVVPHGQNNGTRQRPYITDVFIGCADESAQLQGYFRDTHRSQPSIWVSSRSTPRQRLSVSKPDCAKWPEKKWIGWAFGAPGQAKGQGKAEQDIWADKKRQSAN